VLVGVSIAAQLWFGFDIDTGLFVNASAALVFSPQPGCLGSGLSICDGRSKSGAWWAEPRRATLRCSPVAAQSAPNARDVVWPPRLIQPERPPAVVYLDLNHYINMAKVVAGKTVDGYAELLASTRRAAADGRAVFVLSATHLMEVMAIKDPRQRSDIADVMAELSGFIYMLTLVKGWASPDDPALADYWAARRRRGRPRWTGPGRG
jgi:hypothetical protein